MAETYEVVSADHKDEPGVEEAVTILGDRRITSYMKVQKVDDLDAKITDDVQTVRFAAPQWVEPVAEDKEKGVEAEEGFWRMTHREIDLGKKNRDSLATALKKYVEGGREFQSPGARVGARPASSSGSVHDLDAIRHWAQNEAPQAVLNGRIVKNTGRIAGDVKEAYYRITGKPNPEAQ